MKNLQTILPTRVFKAIGDKKIRKIDLGRSGVSVFKIENYGYLKIGSGSDCLTDEKNRCLWLENRAVAPKVIDFGRCLCHDETVPLREFLLISEVKGLPLCDESFLCDPCRLVSLIGEAMATFHAIDASDCPFIAEGCSENFENIKNPLLCHGDFCLPNILYDGTTLGFVDLGGMGKGDAWLDYAWALWSLDYNLKTDAFRPLLLKTLNIEFDLNQYQFYTSL